MKTIIVAFVTGGLCGAAFVSATQGHVFSHQQSHKEPAMTRHAAGTFDVKTTPIAADDAIMGTGIGRYSLVKQYHGELEASAKGEMLGAGDPSTGSAGYVAMEQVNGNLAGHAGSFALQHSGVMDSTGLTLSVAVVPGSGTGQLKGISGTLTITNNGGHHSYVFDYSLPVK
jgi:hypothetical protein